MSIELENMDGVDPAKPFSNLSLGWNEVTIEDATEDTSSGGHPMVKLDFMDATGRSQMDWIVFAPSKKAGEPSFAMRKARALLDACGIEAEKGKSSFPTSSLLHKKCAVFVDEEPDNRPEYRGQMRARIQGYRPPGQGSDVPGDTAGLANGGGSNDDIPF